MTFGWAVILNGVGRVGAGTFIVLVLGGYVAGIMTGTFIGLAYVARGLEAPGTALEIDIRGRRQRAHVVQRPFYRRAR